MTPRAADPAIDRLLEGHSRNRRPISVKMSNLVKFNPMDSRAGLNPLFQTDPLTFKPKPDDTGRVQMWGLYPGKRPSSLCMAPPHPHASWPSIAAEDEWSEATDPMEFMMRMMQSQSLYGSGRPFKDKPEVQFAKILAAKKCSALAAAQSTSAPLARCDMTLEIELDKV